MITLKDMFNSYKEKYSRGEGNSKNILNSLSNAPKNVHTPLTGGVTREVINKGNISPYQEFFESLENKKNTIVETQKESKPFNIKETFGKRSKESEEFFNIMDVFNEDLNIENRFESTENTDILKVFSESEESSSDGTFGVSINNLKFNDAPKEEPKEKKEDTSKKENSNILDESLRDKIKEVVRQNPFLFSMGGGGGGSGASSWDDVKEVPLILKELGTYESISSLNFVTESKVSSMIASAITGTENTSFVTDVQVSSDGETYTSALEGSIAKINMTQSSVDESDVENIVKTNIKISDIENDSNFVTETEVQEMINLATDSEVNSMLSDIGL